MRAVTIRDEQIEVADRPDPTPGTDELLVAVRTAGLNGADLAQWRGAYPPPPGASADIPGLELAGEVVATGAGVRRFAVGDRVMGITGGGAQAELAVLHERVALPVPEGLDWTHAGGFPEAFTTAHDALFAQGALQTGERLLVHGAAGGVGTAAVQLGVVAGAQVTATVRRAESRAPVAALGAEVVAPDAFVDHGPFDVILELVGADNLPGNLRALATGGRICAIGFGAGAVGELDLMALARVRGRIHASTLRSRPLEEKALTARRLERSVLPHLASGRLAVLVAATDALEDAPEAYAGFAAGGTVGKRVLVTGR